MRRLPTEGARVTIVYLNARDGGVIDSVEDAGRTVVVVTDDDEVLRFGLTATGAFRTADHGCRLVLEG